MDVLRHPLRTGVRFRPAKTYANGKPTGYPTHRLMEESGVACPKAPHQIVHSQFEFLWIIKRENGVSALRGAIPPVGPIEVGIEVIFRNLRDSFIENPSALFEGQFCWSRN